MGKVMSAAGRRFTGSSSSSSGPVAMAWGR
jgi:hypothetical protein